MSRTLPRHEFEYAFTPAIVRTAMKRDFIWRGWAFAAFALAVVLGWRGWAGEFNGLILATCMVSTLAVCAVLFRAVHVGARRLCEFWSNQSPDGIIRFVLDDDGLEVRLEKSTSRYAWKELRRLWRYRDIWLIEIVKNVSVFFPPDAAPDEARDFIVERCRSAGVRC